MKELLDFIDDLRKKGFNIMIKDKLVSSKIFSPESAIEIIQQHKEKFLDAVFKSLYSGEHEPFCHIGLTTLFVKVTKRED